MSTDPHDDPDENDEDGGAQMLVSEFPPPPNYYRLAASSLLVPPTIPTDALERAAKKANAIAARARADAERLRKEATLRAEDAGAAAAGGGVGAGVGGGAGGQGGATDAAAAAEIEASAAGTVGVSAGGEGDGDDDEDLVAVFGEIVEDPLLVTIEDACDDPTVVRDEMMRLNRDVMQGFVKLVSVLVHRPLENKKCRDELSHNIFLMLQECNKFREHQAREILIETLECQLAERKTALRELKDEIQKADDALKEINGVAPWTAKPPKDANAMEL